MIWCVSFSLVEEFFGYTSPHSYMLLPRESVVTDFNYCFFRHSSIVQNSAFIQIVFEGRWKGENWTKRFFKKRGFFSITVGTSLFHLIWGLTDYPLPKLLKFLYMAWEFRELKTIDSTIFWSGSRDSTILFLDVSIVSLNESLSDSKFFFIWTVLTFFNRCDVEGAIQGLN